MQRVQSTYFRAPKLKSMLPGEPRWMYLAFNPRRCGTMMAIDGKERWLIHNFLYNGEPDYDSVDRDWAIRNILGVGPEFEYESDFQGGLDRPPAGRRPFPERPCRSSPAMPRIFGFRTPATA